MYEYDQKKNGIISRKFLNIKPKTLSVENIDLKFMTEIISNSSSKEDLFIFDFDDTLVSTYQDTIRSGYFVPKNGRNNEDPVPLDGFYSLLRAINGRPFIILTQRNEIGVKNAINFMNMHGVNPIVIGTVKKTRNNRYITVPKGDAILDIISMKEFKKYKNIHFIDDLQVNLDSAINTFEDKAPSHKTLTVYLSIGPDVYKK